MYVLSNTASFFHFDSLIFTLNLLNSGKLNIDSLCGRGKKCKKKNLEVLVIFFFPFNFLSSQNPLAVTDDIIRQLGSVACHPIDSHLPGGHAAPGEAGRPLDRQGSIRCDKK